MSQDPHVCLLLHEGVAWSADLYVDVESSLCGCTLNAMQPCVRQQYLARRWLGIHLERCFLRRAIQARDDYLPPWF
jgi:hypothetical protein